MKAKNSSFPGGNVPQMILNASQRRGKISPGPRCAGALQRFNQNGSRKCVLLQREKVAENCTSHSDEGRGSSLRRMGKQ